MKRPYPSQIYLATVVSLLALSACGQDISQTVKTDAPKLNSENVVVNSGNVAVTNITTVVNQALQEVNKSQNSQFTLQDVVYRSSDSSIAEVKANGDVIPLKDGMVKIQILRKDTGQVLSEIETEVKAPTQTQATKTITGCDGKTSTVPIDTPTPLVSCPPALSAPGNLSLALRTASDIKVTWNAVTGASRYRVYLNGQSYDAGTATSYTFSGLASTTQYSIAVESVDDAGQSARSGNLSVTTEAQLSTALPTPRHTLNPGYGYNHSAQQGQTIRYDLTALTPGQAYLLRLSPQVNLDLYAGSSTEVSSSLYAQSAAHTGSVDETIQFTPSGSSYYAAVQGVEPGNYSISLATATPVPEPVHTSDNDISVVEKTSFGGKVYEDIGGLLEGATVRAKSLNSSVPYEATTSTSNGNYSFNNAPAGVQLEITASKNGYTIRKRVEVLQSNKSGDPSVNQYNFSSNDALSDKPEVISVIPSRNASGVNPDAEFVLKFSEPMDRATVEDNFGIWSASSSTLSVGITLAGGTVSNPQAGSLIWESSAFDISWNSDDTEASFSFSDERRLPSDTDSSAVPDYIVALLSDGGQIKDKTGIVRSDSPFRLTSSGSFENGYKFSIDADEKSPQVVSIEATDDGGDGDEISVEFSEPMLLNTRADQIMGQGSHSPLDASNYMMAVSGIAPGPLESIASYGVSNIRFDSDDDTSSTVLIQFSDGTAFAAGDRVAIEVTSSLVDPAGNSIDSGNNSEDDTAN